MNLVELKGISFSYDNGTRVLENFSWRLKTGERMGLTGENGAGKTTLFQIVLGLLKPQAGDVTLFGKPCSAEKDFREARRKIGLLFQDPDDQLFCPTVLEDVAFGPLNMGLTHKDARDRAEATLDELGLLHLKDRSSYQLSGGEKRLVSLATVLSMHPEVLLLDEPTIGVDERMMERLLTVLGNYSASAMVVISHDHDVLKALVDTSIRLREGMLLQSSP